MAKRLPTFEGSESPDNPTRTDSPSLVDNKTVSSKPLDNTLTGDLSPDGAEQVDSPGTDDEKGEVLECAICLQSCIHPVQLPCSHIFCFLCVKGVAIQSKRCALCRQDIPLDFFNNPALLRRGDLYKESAYEGCYQWYYQGMNGWWQYDERASSDIEEYYKAGNKYLEILIAGFLYVIDYDNMLQFRRNDPSRRRKIKRDLISIPDKKGVAGLKVQIPSTEPESPHRLQGDGGENVPCVVQNKQSKTKNSASTAGSRRVTRSMAGQNAPSARPSDRNASQTGSQDAASRLTAARPENEVSASVKTGHAGSTRSGGEPAGTTHTPRGVVVDRDGVFTATRTPAGGTISSNTSPRVPHNTPEGQHHAEPTATSSRDLEQENTLSMGLSSLQLSDTQQRSRSTAKKTRPSRSKRSNSPHRAYSSDEEDWQ